MTLDQLRYFLAAAKYEHVARAAQSVPISASVISQAIKQLEEEFSCEFFDRENKKMRLTKQGFRMFELATTLIQQVDQVGRELGKTDLALAGHYRIGSSHFLATKMMTPIWTNLQRKHPRLTADIYSQPTWILVDNILAGRLDFAIGFSPTPHPQIETEEVYGGVSEIVVRKNHPIFSRASRDHYKYLHEYPGTMHIATEKIMGTRPHSILKALQLDSNITFGFDNDFVALENLRASNNWSFMLDIVARDFSKYLKSIPIPRKSEAHYTIQIMRHKSKKVDGAMREVFELIKEYFGQH